MNEMQRKVRDFHEKFNQTVNDEPQIPSPEDMNLRIRLMNEELNGSGELVESIQKQDLIGIADGLGDLLYVLLGTAVTYGIDLEPIFNEIHRSNMTKLWEDGKPRYDEHGKVVKPATYSPANIGRELNLQQREGHEDKTVYRLTRLPIKIEGIPVGEGDVFMDNQGNVHLDGVIWDVTNLPMINEFSLKGMSTEIRSDDEIEFPRVDEFLDFDVETEG